MRRVLLAGIGNIFLSDDGWGVEAAARLAQETWPEGVRVEEFGIRGIHLAYELLEGYDALVLVDAVPMGDRPGTLAVLEPDQNGALPIPGSSEAGIDPHSMGPDVVLGTLARLGGKLQRVVVIGCQPASLEEGIGLSPAVAASLDAVVGLCREVVEEIVQPAGKGTNS
jgi:hydrogenase maturation protease